MLIITIAAANPSKYGNLDCQNRSLPCGEHLSSSGRKATAGMQHHVVDRVIDIFVNQCFNGNRTQHRLSTMGLADMFPARRSSPANFLCLCCGSGLRWSFMSLAGSKKGLTWRQMSSTHMVSTLLRTGQTSGCGTCSRHISCYSSIVTGCRNLSSCSWQAGSHAIEHTTNYKQQQQVYEHRRARIKQYIQLHTAH